MDRRTIIIGFAIIILIIVIGYFMFGKVNEPETSSIIIPSIVYEESRMDIKPYIDYKVEGYRIEYAAMYTDRELSDLVNFTINWKNKAGFDNVTKIRITRKVGSTTVQTIPKNKYRDDGAVDTDNIIYFENFGRSILSVKFEGVPSDFSDSSDIFGENVFSIEYSIDGTNFSPVTGINTTNMTKGIDRGDVLVAVEENKFVSVQFNPKIEQSGEITKQFVNDEGYYFYPQQPSDLQYSVNSIFYGQISIPLYIVIGIDNNVGGVLLKKTTDNNFLNVNQSGNIISADTGYEFNIIEVPGTDNTDKIILGRYVTISNVKKIDKVLVIEDNVLKVINFDDISTIEVYNSMFLTYNTSEQISRVECTTSSSPAYNCSDETTIPGINNRRGRKFTRVNINDKGIGDGECNVNVNGVDFSLLDYNNNNDISRVSPTQYLVATNCDIDCEYEINESIAKPQCTARDCYKTIDGDSVRKLGQGRGYKILQGWNVDGTQKVCPETTQRVDCVGQGWLGPCDPCDPILDGRICDAETTTSPQTRYIKTYKADTESAKCEPTPSVKVTEWNQSDARKYEDSTSCPASCKEPNWDPRPSCDRTTKKTEYTNTARKDSTQLWCNTPSQPTTTSTPQGCVSCRSKSVGQSDDISDVDIAACDNLEGCKSQVTSGWTMGGNKETLTCLGEFGY